MINPPADHDGASLSLASANQLDVKAEMSRLDAANRAAAQTAIGTMVAHVPSLEVPVTSEVTAPVTEAVQEAAENSVNRATGKALAHMDDVNSAASDAYATSSQATRDGFHEVADVISQLNWKLMQFAGASAQSNLDFMRNYAGARTMSDFMELHAAYIRRQYEMYTGQMQELQSLTAEISGKAAAPFKEQFSIAAQMFRS